MQQNETEIITRILGGESELYGQLIDRYKNGLYRHCFTIMRDEDAAQDIAQETFIEAYVHLAQYNRAFRFSTWLYKIATNKALGALRKKQAVRLSDQQWDLITSTLPQTNHSALAREVREAVDKLPHKHKTAIILYYLQGRNQKYIAKHMGTTVGSVKSWISRAKKQLKEVLS